MNLQILEKALKAQRTFAENDRLIDRLLFLLCRSDKGSGHGILEFSTDKAGQDVTPLNLEFDEPKQRSSTLNSITGEQSFQFPRLAETILIFLVVCS